MKRKWPVIVLLVLIPVLIYLFWPLASDKYEISDNAGAIKLKQQYLQTPVEKPVQDAPNILLITVDDLGMADCSLYGEGIIETPNIDKLGDQGVVFENAYVTSPVCAPSRAALITGRYQHRFGFEFTMQARYLRNRLEYLGFRYFIDSHPWLPRWSDAVPRQEDIDRQGLPLSEITLADVLKKQGYNTGIVGKWHLGWSEKKRPSAFGFDEQYGFFTSHSLYVPEGTQGYVDQKIENDWTDDYIWSGQRNGPHAITRNYVEIDEQGYLTDRITQESVEFIQKQKNEPWFLWTSYNAPHTPLQAPQEYVDRFRHIDDPVKRVYRAMIASLDDNIGRLMAAIDSLGPAENTLVFLISDNGGAEYTHTTDNGRYEGGKNTDFEGGNKVPMIVRWTGVVPAGKRFDPMVSAMDIFTTSTHAAGAIYLDDRPLDGVDLMPYLRDTVPGYPHDYLFWQRGVSKVVRNNEWKLVMNEYIGDVALYNLLQDQYELPVDPTDYPGVVKELKAAFQDWALTHASPMWPSVVYFTAEKDGKTWYFEQ